MSLCPKKKQWKDWSLPSKLTAIGTLLAILTFGLYIVEKSFNLLEWALQTIPQPIVSIELQFPYERSGGAVIQNNRNPELTITNRGIISISPIIVDVSMFLFSPSLSKVLSSCELNYRTHGHLIFEPELKPGSSVKASLVGIKNWTRPAAYRIRTQTITQSDKDIPLLDLLFLIDKNGIKAEHSKLSNDKVVEIKSAIQFFEKNNDTEKKLVLEAPIDGVWIPHTAPGAKMHLNEDGTLTVE